MRAMVLTEVGKPLELKEIQKPEPASDEVLIRVLACGICRTDLHLVDGELPSPKLPLIPGHQIIGEVEAAGESLGNIKIGDRVGVPWLGGSCGVCDYCKTGHENLCSSALYTGYKIDGGFAEYCTAKGHFVFSIPRSYSDLQAAPLLCAGLIGYRALRMTGNARRIGFYGFGASAHILIQIVLHKGGEVYAFTKNGDVEGQEFAKSLGAVWAGSSEEEPPSLLDAAIIFAPVGALVPKALGGVKKGGVVVCAGIHMSDIPAFPYNLLWNEKIVRSVANLTRKDGEEFLALAPNLPIITEVNPYPLEKTNEALEDLRHGRFKGAAVIVVN
ncbi:MAG: zinc-dependent alcohol dehydrogenase family protein [Chlamydiales bacterium]|nr:zinc-dependent alcohol dehydrogenase family protein [Chlamydiales bacterium]